MKLSTIIYFVWLNLKIWVLKFLRLEKHIMPYKILINLTDLCNSRCTFCSIWKKVHDQQAETIKLAELTSLFHDIGGNLVWLSLSGGEVTLYKPFKQMIQEAKRNCPNLKVISFTTNALNPQKALEYAKLIKDNGFDALISISLDGDEQLHDSLRGVKGNYKKCYELYEMLKEERISAHFGITIGEQNLDFILQKYAQVKHDIKAVTFVHSGGIYQKDNTNDLEPILTGLKHINKHYSIDHLSEIIEKIHIKTAIRFIKTAMQENIIPCEVLTTSLHIMPDGGIYPCMFLEEIGNLKKDKITDIMKTKSIEELKNSVQNNQCPHCWMNCYSPFSIMQHPIKALRILFS